jgi:LCP family protein required for cell wall assembly
VALRPRRWPRRLLIAANVMVAVAILGVATAYGYVNWRFGQIHTKNLSALTTKGPTGGGGGGNPFTLLVVGSDSRAALSANGDPSQFGSSASVAGQRSDTIILVRVVPKTRQLMILSIPRDLWGPIPGNGSNRINVAFDTGANLLIQTIQQDLGVPINHYVEVNFDTFRDISNAVGGVNFYFPTPAKDTLSNLSIPAAGCYSLKGDQALAFVRSRHYEYYQDGYWHYEAESDLARIQRQQAFIKKMIKKAEGDYTNPFALNAILGGITKNLTVDSGFGSSLMLTLAKDFRSMDPTGIPNLTLPTYPYTTAGGAEVLGLQQPQASQTVAAFNSFGNPPPKPAAKPPPSQPATTMPPVTVPPARVSIEVANGTGTSGQAGQMTQVLAALGYHSSLTASPGYGHATTEVRYAPDSLTAARQVAARIPGGATLVSAPDLTPTVYNLEVVTGSSFTAPAASGSAGSTTSSTNSTSTTVPGTNSAVYQLPGAPTGQATPPC